VQPLRLAAGNKRSVPEFGQHRDGTRSEAAVDGGHEPLHESYVALVVPVLNTFRRWNHCGNFMQAFRYRPGLITTPDLLNKLANRPSTGECATPSDAEQRRPHVLAAHTVATVYSKACTMA